MGGFNPGPTNLPLPGAAIMGTTAEIQNVLAWLLSEKGA